ncbi:molybdopterin molybdotransferase MoeA [Romboutsia lituseburensis]|uniref:Molybdopterin molybdenumtransferase n=1 Tax=Romboutsia lituseburensis DSM 797 TaxID=1121325 RepID=A0A1G9KLW6_9FIRM|nr:molybdopterin molybdotransferase MoeA [Romboutsia lituseburensis]CEH34964.1 Molybdopterin molybdenumtransferase [Romboutsia lituseburensis]SDL50721.1 molybdopterin molybdotransferase [Romboutsia lituseburensis DSM 797]
MKLFDVVNVEDALSIIKSTFIQDLKVESVNLVDSFNRYLAKDIVSDINVPHFRKSTVDGYAVRFEDVISASTSNPTKLKLLGESQMGQVCKFDLDEDECVYVPTGAMIPLNAHGVIMMEYCDKLNDKEVYVQKNTLFNENIVEVGEDIKEDEILYKKGHLINERDLGVLAGANIKDVLVYKDLVVGIISTGDEILNINEEINDAKIKDINAYILYGQFKKMNLNPKIYPPVKDNLEDIINLMKQAINECDIVLISGGSSVGKKDETLKAIESFKNSKVFVEGIALKPGKPTIISSVENKLVVGLPGHPLSCAFVVESLIKPYINSLFECKEDKYIICEFEYNYHKSKGREEVLAVNIKNENNKVICMPIFSKSSTIKQFAKCDGYIRINRELEGVNKGDLVKVYLF